MGNSSGGRAASLLSWESHPSAVLAEPSFDGSIIILFFLSSPSPGTAPAFVMDLYRSEADNIFSTSSWRIPRRLLEEGMCLMKCIIQLSKIYLYQAELFFCLYPI